MNISDIRQQYPQYADLSDQQLVDGLHQKYYSDMPQNQFYQKIGFQPNSDFAQAHPALAAINMGAMQGTGNALNDLGDALQNAKNALSPNIPNINGLPPLQGLQNYNPGQAISNFGQNINQNAGQLTGLPSPSAGQALSANVLGVAPQIIGGADAAYDLGKTGLNLINSKNLDNVASNIYQNLSQNLSPKDLNKTNVQNIVNNYNDMSDQIGAAYTKLKADAANMGYATSGSKGLPGIEEGTATGKFIIPENSVNTIIDKNPSDINQGLLQNVSGSLKNMIARYQSSPTFNNAHDLQSMLGSEAANLKSGLNSGIPQMDTANALTNARNSLKQDITNTFNRNGDQYLAQKYQSLSDLYKNNLAPYQNVPQIWSAIKGKPYTGNISNVLSNDDDAGNIAAIRNHLMQNPNQQQTLLAQALGKVGTKNANGEFQVNNEKLLNNYNNLPDSLQQFASPQTDNLFNQLENSKALRSKLLKYGAGAATVGGAILGAHHFLGD